MNTSLTTVFAALAFAAGAAQAGDLVTLPTERSTLTRAEVQAELLRARANGELTASGDSYGLQWAGIGGAARLPAFAARARDDARSEARGTARPGKSTDYVGG